MSTSQGRWGRHGVADALRERRASLGLTRKDVAERSGLSYPYVSQLENGDREPSLDALSKLADALGIPAEDLIKGGPAPLTSAEPSAAPSAPKARTGAPPGRWLKNPAYSPAPSAPTRGTRAEAIVEDAYQLLLELPAAARLDAAGALLARCVRDSHGGN